MWPIIAGAAASIATSAIGSAASASDRAAASRLRQQVLDYYTQLMPPDYSDVRTFVEDLAKNNMIDPQTQMSILQLDSEGRSKVGDPKALEAQEDAMNYLTSVMDSEGMTPKDQSFFLQVSDQMDQQIKSQEAAIMANMQERGVAGGGMELAAKLSSGQAAAQNASRAGLDLLAMSQDRRDSAASQLGNLGLAVRGQQFGEAQARDQALLAANSQNFNIGSQAAQVGYQTRQSEFDNDFQKTNAIASTLQGQAAAKDANAQRVANQWGNVGQGMMSIGGSYQDYLTNQSNQERQDARYDKYLEAGKK